MSSLDVNKFANTVMMIEYVNAVCIHNLFPCTAPSDQKCFPPVFLTCCAAVADAQGRKKEVKPTAGK